MAVRRSMSSSTIDQRSHCPPPRPGMSTRSQHLAGPVMLDIARPLVGIALSAPPVTMAQATALRGFIERDLPDVVLPQPRTDLVEEIRDDPPVPTLMLANRPRRRNYWEVWGKDWEERVDVALLGYAYGDTLIGGDDTLREQRKVEDGRIVIRRRDLAAERSAQDRLRGVRVARDRDVRLRCRGRRSNSASPLLDGRRRLAGLCLRRGAAARARGLAHRGRGRLPLSRRRRRRRVDGRSRAERRLVVLARSRDRDRR